MKNELEERLNQRGIKPTAMRELVLKVMLSENVAISLPELEQKFDRAERTTLYRTLKLFEKNKLIHSIDDGFGAKRFAVCSDVCMCSIEDLHIHFFCEKCKKSYCLTDLPFSLPTLPTGFEFSSANFVISGICADCKK